MALDKEQIAARLRQFQQTICEAIEKEDGKATFQLDQWQRPGGGGGDTRVIENGDVIEKGGVNFFRGLWRASNKNFWSARTKCK